MLPDDGPTLVELKAAGNAAFEAGEYREAVQLFTAALDKGAMEKDFSEIPAAALYSNRAAAHVALNQPEYAVVDATKAISIRPEWHKGYFRLGQAYRALDKLPEALAAWEGARERFPPAEPPPEDFVKAFVALKGEMAARAAGRPGQGTLLLGQDEKAQRANWFPKVLAAFELLTNDGDEAFAAAVNAMECWMPDYRNPVSNDERAAAQMRDALRRGAPLTALVKSCQDALQAGGADAPLMAGAMTNAIIQVLDELHCEKPRAAVPRDVWTCVSAAYATRSLATLAMATSPARRYGVRPDRALLDALLALAADATNIEAAHVARTAAAATAQLPGVGDDAALAAALPRVQKWAARVTVALAKQPPAAVAPWAKRPTDRVKELAAAARAFLAAA